MENLNHLINLNDYPVKIWDKIIKLAKLIMEEPNVYKGACTGKIMATLFYEASTRTQMSFQSAMLRLGGGIIGFDNPAISSVSKGESLGDTAKTISGYSDVIVMRHNREGAVKAAAAKSDCPIINAGDGGHLHPTQTLTDLLTLTIEKKRLKNLNIGICGDLKYGRTVHSLVRAISEYEGNKFTFISTPELCMPEYIKRGLDYVEVSSIESAIGELDVLYMTRVQRERFQDEQEYERQKSVFTLDSAKLKSAKSDLSIMHPLPRLDEISIEVDSDPRAVYFKQANYGMYVRMALILTILNKKIKMEPLFVGETDEAKRQKKCKNENCIVNHEKSLENRFVKTETGLVCEYCEVGLDT
ncbi:MAG: aspartate carbamoyltransferase [Oscillospiraceae bacterium]|nr:aspartate carbamoyltransferase [Oscillospiraceae bacterium]